MPSIPWYEDRPPVPAPPLSCLSHPQRRHDGDSGGVVHAVFSHRRVDQLVRLLRVLHDESPSAHVVVHHDGAASEISELIAFIGPTARVHVLGPRRHAPWGSYGFVEAQSAVMRWTRRNLGGSWFNVLSGQDYPLRPLQDFDAHLAESHVDAFCEAEPVPRPGRSWRLPESTRRYHFAYRRVPTPYAKLPQRTRAAAERVGMRVSSLQPFIDVRMIPTAETPIVGLRQRRTAFTGRQCMKGADWYTLSGTAVDEVLAALEDHHLPGRLRHTLLPSEAVVPTVVAGSMTLRWRNDNLRCVLWPCPGSPHPKTLVANDLAALMESRKWFARKFDADVDGTILELLDRQRLQQG